MIKLSALIAPTFDNDRDRIGSLKINLSYHESDVSALVSLYLCTLVCLETKSLPQVGSALSLNVNQWCSRFWDNYVDHLFTVNS